MDEGAPATRRAWRAAAMLGILSAAWIVWHPALGRFFAQDDFVGLARAAGLLPRLPGPWRLWSNQLHFDVITAIAGADPRVFHAANLAALAGAGVALHALLARRMSGSAAFVGAAFLVTHPAAFSAMHWVSAIGDPLALALGLASLLAAEGGRRTRWASPLLFAAALLAKESVVLLPLLAIAIRHLAPPRGAPTPRGGGPLVRPHELAMLAVAAAYAAAFYAADVVGVRTGVPGDAAYALGPGPDAARRLLTLLGWSVDVPFPTMPLRFDVVDPLMTPWALFALAVAAAGALDPGLRARGWIAALVAFALLLAPVLPLRHHTYRYFLVAPLAGTAWALAALADVALVRARPWLRAGAAAPLGVLLALNGAEAARRVESARSVYPFLHADPVVDRSIIAGHVVGSLREARFPAGSPLVFLAPRLRAEGGADSPEQLEAWSEYYERNLRAAIAESLAVRLFVPDAGPLRFVRRAVAVPPGARWVLYRPDGRCQVFTPAALDSLSPGGVLRRDG